MNHILVHYPDCVGVITADADGQHAVADILSVADEMKKNPDKVILGSRRFDTAVPLRSRFGNAVSRYVYRFLIGLNLGDTQTGLRGIPRRLMALSLGIRANRYEFETEQLVSIQATRIQIQSSDQTTISTATANCILTAQGLCPNLFHLLQYSVTRDRNTDLVVFASWMALSDDLCSQRAGTASLWLQFTLQNFVPFARHRRALVLYLGLVVVSGVISTALSLRLQHHSVPVVAKVLAGARVRSISCSCVILYLTSDDALATAGTSVMTGRSRPRS
jgi:hypothetical protein